MQALTNNTGENATPLNPFDKDKFRIAHVDHAAQYPQRPLTERQEPNMVIEVSEAWQYKHEDSTIWSTVKPIAYKRYASFRDFMGWNEGRQFATRLAYAPTTAPVAKDVKGKETERIWAELEKSGFDEPFSFSMDDTDVANKVEGVEEGEKQPSDELKASKWFNKPTTQMIDNKELEEAALAYFDSLCISQKAKYYPIKGFIAGATHQDKIAVDRTVEEVVNLIECCKELNYLDLYVIITQIQNLKNDRRK